MFTRFSLPKVEQRKVECVDYVAIHDDPQRGFSINLGNSVKLNGISPIMIDMIDTINNAKEIHLIDSSYSVLIWFLNHVYNLCKQPTFLHNSKRPGRDIGIYTYKLPSNWKVI